MKKLLIALLVVTGLVSCNGGKSFKINVNLENSNGKTVYLERYDNDKMVTLDSVVAKNNVAVFKVKASDNLDALHIMMQGWRRPLAFFADNQDVTITGDYQKYNGINVSASETQDKLNQLLANSDNMEDEETYYSVLDFVKQNIDNPVGPYVLYRYKWAFSLDYLERLYEAMPANMISGYKILVLKYIKGLQITSQGSSYIDFKLKDVDGNDFVFSDIFKSKTKIVILDFWASWCPDCRKDNVGLVAVYNEFKDKGLDVVSVSLDTDADAWKKAIKDDNLAWNHHVSDLKGWSNSVAELYTIAYIPQNFIIDRNGVIVEKNLTNEKLRECISSLLK